MSSAGAFPHERRRNVWSVVYVLVEHPVLPVSFATDKPHRIDIQQQASCTELSSRLGIEHMCAAEAQFKTLVAIWVLVQQKPQISRRDMIGSDGQ